MENGVGDKYSEFNKVNNFSNNTNSIIMKHYNHMGSYEIVGQSDIDIYEDKNDQDGNRILSLTKLN